MEGQVWVQHSGFSLGTRWKQCWKQMVMGSNLARPPGNLYSAYPNPIKTPHASRLIWTLAFVHPPRGPWASSPARVVQVRRVQRPPLPKVLWMYGVSWGCLGGCSSKLQSTSPSIAAFCQPWHSLFHVIPTCRWFYVLGRLRNMIFAWFSGLSAYLSWLTRDYAFC